MHISAYIHTSCDYVAMKHSDSTSQDSASRSPSVPLPKAKPRYIMVGGFLGAGKTTSIAKLAQWLTDKGLRVGLITNDQGSHLVDTTMLTARGFAVKEIPGGCFCCRFNSLVDAAKLLKAESRPDVFIAEPVGSCTDLVATVSYPLRNLYGADYSIAPLSVLVDPIRVLRVLGLEAGGQFSEKVVYIYRKQLEEADLIVVNKRDLLSNDQSATLREALAAQFPKARVFEVSARQGTGGLEGWFEHIARTNQIPRAIMDVDYEVYADGEARLGWLNCTLRLDAKTAFDGNKFVHGLASEIQQRLNRAGAEIAHLKITLDADNELSDLAVVNLVRNDFVPELSQNIQDSFAGGELTINMRAEAAPEVLRGVVQSAVEKCAQPYATLNWEHMEFFRPGKPQPTHRLTTSA
ncbi:MAG TPA: GTP-binding protein [Verrucomicrobiae bacterium]|nr:GTP-binding protein [Verrucomicrobiae bacterium]